jgi:hypothetical protein
MVDGALMLIVMVTMEFIFAVSVYMISFDFSLIDITIIDYKPKYAVQSDVSSQTMQTCSYAIREERRLISQNSFLSFFFSYTEFRLSE